MIEASLEGKIITVIGGSGFLGRYIVGRLLKAGASVRVVSRDREQAMHLKPLASPGMLVILSANICDTVAMQAVITGSDYVINLVGILYERGAQKFHKIHVEGASNIAKISHACQVRKLIYVSAIGASEDSSAKYAYSKALAEAQVNKHFPNALIIRPSLIFGPHDHFFNRMASLARILPIFPLVGGGQSKFQPVYAGDIAIFIHKLLLKSKLRHKIYELGGADVMNMEELLRVLLGEIGYKRILVSVPFRISLLIGRLLSLFPKPVLTAEQVYLLQQDNVVDSRLPGLADLGVRPQTLLSILPSYMDAYCKGGRYATLRQHYHAQLLAEEDSNQYQKMRKTHSIRL